MSIIGGFVSEVMSMSSVVNSIIIHTLIHLFKELLHGRLQKKYLYSKYNIENYDTDDSNQVLKYGISKTSIIIYKLKE